MSGTIDANKFYQEYHGHRIEDLEVLHSSLAEKGKEHFIYFIGDSSLDNKFWLFSGNVPQSVDLSVEEEGDELNPPGSWGNLTNGYEDILWPPVGVRDVAYWMNWRIAKLSSDTKWACINSSIEESRIASRNSVLMPQDEFVKRKLTSNDVVICSVGGNDVALKPTLATIASMLWLTRFVKTSTIENATEKNYPFGAGHFIKLYGARIKDFILRVLGDKRPKLVMVCMIYYPDVAADQSWADRSLNAMGYTKNPTQLQAVIRMMFRLATCKIDIPGVKVVPIPLYERLDGKNTAMYDCRVEPSVLGGDIMADMFSKVLDDEGLLHFTKED